MIIKREILRQHLHNTPLVQTIEQKQQIDTTRKKLRGALQIMSEIEVSETAIADVQSKYDEYGKISSGYSNLLEDVFGISWQKILLLTVFAGIVILLASLLNLAAVAVVQHYENKPTVYEVKYTFNDESSVDRLERLISES